MKDMKSIISLTISEFYCLLREEDMMLHRLEASLNVVGYYYLKYQMSSHMQRSAPLTVQKKMAKKEQMIRH